MRAASPQATAAALAFVGAKNLSPSPRYPHSYAALK